MLALAVVLSANITWADQAQEFAQTKDVAGLTRLLQHRDGRVRSSAAVALSGVIDEVEDPKILTPLVSPLVDAALRDPYASVREYAGRALRHSLKHADNTTVLRGAVPALVDMLNAGQVEEKLRLYAAVTLWELVPRIDHEPLLNESIPRLQSAALDDPHDRVREYAGRAFKSAISRSHDEQLLHDAANALARTLSHDDLNRRQYSAVFLSGLVKRIESPDTLRGILSRIREATKSKDTAVAHYASRALRDIERQLEQQAAQVSDNAR